MEIEIDQEKILDVLRRFAIGEEEAVNELTADAAELGISTDQWQCILRACLSIN